MHLEDSFRKLSVFRSGGIPVFNICEPCCVSVVALLSDESIIVPSVFHYVGISFTICRPYCLSKILYSGGIPVLLVVDLHLEDSFRVLSVFRSGGISENNICIPCHNLMVFHYYLRKLRRVIHCSLPF